MDISVVVLTRDRPTHLRRCLDALQRQSVLPREVIVVDGSRKSTAKYLLALFPRLRTHYVRDTVGKIGYARNIGVEKAKGEIVVFIDDDCVAGETFLSQINHHFVLFPYSCVIVARICNGLPNNLYASVQQWYYDRWLLSYYGDYTNKQRVPNGTVVDFEAVGIRREVIKRFRFATSLPFGINEDVEMGVRLFAQYKEIYFDPAIVVTHYPRNSFMSLVGRNFRNGYCDEYLRKVHRIDLRQERRIKSSLACFRSEKIPPLSLFYVLLFIYPLFSKIGRLTYVLVNMLRRLGWR